MTQNLQPVEKSVYSKAGDLEVVDVYHTIQGEGPWAGHPAVFLRLAGCNLQCPGCDTDYTSSRRTLSADTVLARVQGLFPPGMRQATTRLLVISGGEPFRQNIGPLVSKYLSAWPYNHVQIETNGTLYGDWVEDVFGQGGGFCIVCSPKTPEINEDLKPYVEHLKYVLRDNDVDPHDGLPMSSLLCPGRPCRPWKGFEGTVYVQPYDDMINNPSVLMGGTNSANVAAAVKSCMTYGYVLSLQQHKIVGLR